MSRLFILEGVDSTGKSTLARTMSLELQAVYLHASGHRDIHQCMYQHHRNLLEIAEENLSHGMNVVLDRHWPSERAYGSMLRPELQDKYDFEQMQTDVFRLRGTYIWCCRPNYDLYKVSHEAHDRVSFKHLNSQQYYAIHANYGTVFERTEHVKYDVASDGLDLEKYIKNL